MKIIFKISVFCLLFSCTQKPALSFTKFGVKFTAPSGWTLAEEEKINDNGYYVSIEKEGYNASGLLTISWINDSINLTAWLKICEDELKNNMVYRNSHLVFTPVMKGQYNNYSGISKRFSFKLLNLAHEGQIIIFYVGNRTIAIIKQEAIEDSIENKVGFDKLEQSFEVQ